MTRQRMTWAAGSRQAAAAPAIPGYGVEDQDHPAHTQEDPEATDYMIGGPSEFAEDPMPPPYGDSGRPALPGYGVEDQEHPAHKGQVGRQANLMDLVRKKSAKCLVLARRMLPRTASWSEIEDQAFAFMDMADDQLDASLGRLSGDFLAEEQPVALDDELLAQAEPAAPVASDDVMARLMAVEQELMALKRANQNDPKGPTLGTSGKSEEQEKSEEKAISGEHSPAPNMKAAAAWGSLFDSFDTDRDGFVTAEDWGGPRSIFAKFDTDRDGIIARHEVLAKAAEDDEDEPEPEDEPEEDEPEPEEDESKESGKKANAKKGGEIPPQFLENAKKKKEEAEDKKDDEGKESGKKAKKAEDEDEPEVAEDEDEDPEAAAKKAYVKAYKAAKAKLDAKKAKKAEGEDEEEAPAKESGKKAKKGEDEEEVPAKESGKKGGKKATSDKEAFGHMAELDPEEMAYLSGLQMAEEEPVAQEDEVLGCGEDIMGGDEPEPDVAEFFATGFDPMGLADGSALTAADEAAFAEVFGRTAGDEDEPEVAEDEEPKEAEDEEPKEEKQASVRTASARTALRPQPRKPSQGARQVGPVAKTASGRNEIDELSKLWTSSPDVSGAF